MTRQFMLVCLVFTIVHTTACGQQAAEEGPPNSVNAGRDAPQQQQQPAADGFATQAELAGLRAELKKDVDKLRTDTQTSLSTLQKQLETQLDTGFKALGAKIDTIGQPAGEQNANPASGAGGQSRGSLDEIGPNQRPKTLEQRVQELERKVTVMQRVQGNHGTTLAQIAMQGEAGGYHVRFDTNSQSARNEVKRAIKSTVPEKGQFIVRNRTPYHQRLIVDGYEIQIRPYDTEKLPVNPGTVMSWLPGQQKHTWHIGVPDFRQVVELHERAPTSIARWVGY